MTELYIKGPVLSPGLVGRPEMGLTDRPLSPEEIQKAAYTYTAGTPIVDVQHDFRKQAEVVESYIAPEDTQFNGKSYPAGTWFLTSRVTDNKLKQLIRTGELTGFSVGAFPENSVTKGMFTDVKEKDWFALAVSIVKMPFYPEMIFKVFKPDEFIKKHLDQPMEVKIMTEEDKGTSGLLHKVIDYFINKEANISEIETPTAPELTLEDVNQSVENLRSELEKLRTPEAPVEVEPINLETEEPEPTPAEPTVEAEAPEEEEAEPEEVEAEAEQEPEVEEKVIKKSLSPDQATPESKKTFMEELGRDAFGNKI